MRVLHSSPVLRARRCERVRGCRTSWLACLAVLVAALLGCVLPQAASAGGATGLGSSLMEPEPFLTEPTVAPPSSTAALG